MSISTPLAGRCYTLFFCLLTLSLTATAQFRGGSGDGHAKDELSRSVLMPLDLLSFTAAADRSALTVDLAWATTNEVGVDFFTVQRTGDGRRWADLGTHAAAGTSTPGQELSYTFNDPTPLPGRSVYRLKITDFDGSFEYSALEEVRLDEAQQGAVNLTVYPNPAPATGFALRVVGLATSEGMLQADLIDQRGRVIVRQQFDPASAGTLWVDLRGYHLVTGVYALRLAHPSMATAVKRVVIGR